MKTFTLWRREISACFLSPIAYVTMTVYMAVTCLTFLIGVVNSQGTHEPLPLILAESILIWLTVLITVVAMRLFAEEKRAGTIETLMTAPVSEAEVVFGKYLGALTFILLATLPAPAALVLLVRLSPGISAAAVDPGGLLGAGLVLGLVTVFLLAISLVVSLLTANQIVAAICTFTMLWLTLLFGWLLSVLPVQLGALETYVSVTDHIEAFCLGNIDTRPIVLYVSGSLFMLFVAVRVLEARRWKA